MLHADSYYRVTLPRRAVEMIDHDVLNAVTKAAGGVSVTHSVGQWFDDDGELHEDSNDVFQWNFNHLRNRGVSGRVKDLILEVFEATTEKTVMVESVASSGYLCSIVYPTDSLNYL